VFYKFFNIILAVSEELQDYLLSLKIAPEKIKLVQNGIDICLISDQSNANSKVSNHLSLNNSLIFGVVGRLFPDKGHSYFINAFSKIVSEFKEVRAWFVGDGPSKAELSYQIRKQSLDSYITLLGERNDMDKIYKKLDFIVIPSLREGLPYTLLEAMSYKIPILATNVGDIPKLINHDKTGYLVHPKDEESLFRYMRKMLREQDHVKQLAENAYRLVNERFSAKRMVNKIEKLYFKYGNTEN
jgi:glycosyltransferase involved in cell wall biosynthesis